MTATMWIGPDLTLEVGQTGFLIEQSHATQGWNRRILHCLPAYTNVSHQPKLNGWCGTWNDVATYGRGVWVVERIARNGRAFIRELTGEDLRAALEDLGYPFGTLI